MNGISKICSIVALATVLAFYPLALHAKSSQVSISKARQKQLIHLVKQDCGSCHGMTLKGGLGPALTKEALKNKPLLLLQNTITHGRPGTAMPPWKSIINEQEALWISKLLLQGMNHEKE
ncbi:hypothetical protein tinsulaeT_38100 [Thalassotalea insulae]|uniref:Cytochrome c domain-containing protein n=1 Tax=Thalassotalea insulae TaxID=2056778 RepID=A0ABQ6H137_9GAMM|nr:cytochrome c [Thalassotalea insulae]GLX80470.1 hypothetical protein tinsulaeT_38100 [Thalassotalea insulae]